MLVLLASSIMWNLSKLIKSDGGQCTGNPIGYAEIKLKEEHDKDFTCKCIEKTYDYGILPNITLGKY